jgi:photosystem II stability/assembly factor-like uncharacterized protein
LITTPDPKILWRLSGSGTVQRSIDSGTSWEDARTSTTDDLTAGAAPSPTVCWIVGRRGVVVRTTNGRDFERVPFPDSIDLTGIQATDARTARVTTADGRSLATTDGGKSWNVERPF